MINLKQCLLAIVAVALTACGGGGGTQTAGEVGAGGTGVAPPSLSVGPVTGFGSIIVNGVEFDDSAAVRTIEDGDDDGTGIKLGVVTRVEGKINTDRITGKADRIEMGAEVRGPVQSIDKAARTLVAMGASVTLTAATLFDGVLTDLSNLNPGDTVQVHGPVDANGTVTASRLQKRTTNLTTIFKTVGKVNAGATQTQLTINSGLIVTLSSATSVRDLALPVAAGTLVRIKSAAAPVSNTIAATQLRPLVSAPQAGATEAKIEGYITDNSGGAASFKVAGLAVSVSSSTQYLPAGSQADLTNGKLVEIEGTIANGVILATKVKFENVSGGGEYRFKGPVTDYVSAADFKIKGQRIDASGSTVRVDNGTVADLNNPTKNQNVEVRGNVFNGDKLVATRVTFK
jgi:Domain of unknown function (DUF5666)